MEARYLLKWKAENGVPQLREVFTSAPKFMAGLQDRLFPEKGEASCSNRMDESLGGKGKLEIGMSSSLYAEGKSRGQVQGQSESQPIDRQSWVSDRSLWQRRGLDSCVGKTKAGNSSLAKWHPGETQVRPRRRKRSLPAGERETGVCQLPLLQHHQRPPPNILT